MRTLAAVLLLCACSPTIAAETLVACTAKWCGPCKRFHADLEQDPALVGARNLQLVDADDDREEIERLKVKAFPTFILLGEDGREVRRTSGYQDAWSLRKWLDRR